MLTPMEPLTAKELINMFKLIVTKNGQTQQSDFATEQECLEHFEKYKDKGFWGKEEYSIDHPIVEAVYATVIHPAEPALLDESKVEVVPAKEEWSEKVLVSEEIPAWTEIVPREYSYEILPVIAVLEPISPRQLRLILLSLGVTESSVDATINSLPSPTKEQAMIAWKYSTMFERNQPMVEALAMALGLSMEQLDVIWSTGITI